MATFKIYKLHFTAPLHIGDQHADDGSSLKTIHSDTLYAALTACLAMAGNTIPEDGDLGFTTSSLFPYFQKDADSKPVYFLPMPMMVRMPELEDFSNAKKVKKVKWVDSALYDAVLTGNPIFDHQDKYLSCIQESYLTTIQLPEDTDGSKEFVRSEISQRVRIDSRTGEKDAEPYYVDRILFNHHAGLYFIADGDTTLLDKALSILAAEGIGTDRSVGFGFFDFTTDSLTIDLPDDADHQMALSLLIPESKTQLTLLMDSEKTAYEFTRRGGWITTYPYTKIRKNVIYGFEPGSVFHKEPEKKCSTIGRIVSLKPEIGELTPDFPIWRCGKSIMLPIKLK